MNGILKTATDVTERIDNSAGGLVKLLEGKNFGKAVLKI